MFDSYEIASFVIYSIQSKNQKKEKNLEQHDKEIENYGHINISDTDEISHDNNLTDQEVI